MIDGWPIVNAAFRVSELLKRTFDEEAVETIINMARLIHESFGNGHKLLICGNGGSAAQADHLAAEFLVRLRPHVNRRPFPALSLSMDSSTLTAHANDYGYDGHFARMVEAFGQSGDVLMTISTSGKSPNCYLAEKIAKGRDMVTLGLYGQRETCLCSPDLGFYVPCGETARIQEMHLMVCHMVAELVEDMDAAKDAL